MFGAPGSGKTTVLHTLGLLAWFHPERLGLETRLLPLVLNLRSLALTKDDAVSMGDWFLRAWSHAGFFRPFRRPEESFLDDWAQGLNCEWLVILDAFDEVPKEKRKNLVEQLITLCDSPYPLLISTRPTQGNTEVLDLCNYCSTFELRPMNQKQLKQILQHILGADADTFLDKLSQEGLLNVCRTPLLVSLATEVSAGTIDRERSRYSLYEAYVDAAIGRLKTLKTDHLLGGDDLARRMIRCLRWIIESLALEEIVNVDQPCRAQLLGFLTSLLSTSWHVNQHEAKATSELLLDALSADGSLLIAKTDSVQWRHLVLRDYLAASALATKAKADEDIWMYVDCWQSDDWYEVVKTLPVLLSRASWTSQQRRLELVMTLLQRIVKKVVRTGTASFSLQPASRKARSRATNSPRESLTS